MEELKIGVLKSIPTKLLSDGGDTNPLYVFSGTLNTTLYTDITSNSNWMSIGINEYDYLFCRNQVTMYTTTNGWTGLTTEEKKVAAKNFSVESDKRLEVYSDSELQGFWTKFVVVSQDVREKRWKAAKSYISYVLPMIDSIDLGKTTKDLNEEYIKYGVESYALDGEVGLFDYLENTNTYSGSTGFSGKTYWTQDYADNIMTILRDGIY